MERCPYVWIRRDQPDFKVRCYGDINHKGDHVMVGGSDRIPGDWCLVQEISKPEGVMESEKEKLKVKKSIPKFVQISTEAVYVFKKQFLPPDQTVVITALDVNGRVWQKRGDVDWVKL